jgi:methyl-accepting chemotaxis protein
MNQNGVSGQLKSSFYKAIGVLSIMIILLMTLIITITFVNKSVFETYGSGQGKVGSLQLKFNSLQDQLRYLVYDANLEAQEDCINRIEALSEELVKDASSLADLMKKEESKEAYKNINTLLQEYMTVKAQIIQYERTQGKYNSTKIYSSEATSLAKELEKSISLLFAFMSKQGAAFSNTTLLISVLATIAALLIIISSLIIMLRRVNNSIRSICDPLKELTEASKEIAQGNLQVKIKGEGENEIGVLAQGLSITVESLNIYIQDISDKLQHIVENDLTVTLDQEYIGDFKPIQRSLAKILDFLNHVFRQIEQASNEVHSGAGQVSEGAISLAEGTSSQNEAILEISTAIRDISNNAKSNEMLCESADRLSRSARSSAEIGREKMNGVVAMMAVINNTSEQISIILQSINDIADQTNLLALNAQIEAARAGESGKGFTVVANEVAKLAEKCSVASKQTEKMIKDTLNAVRLGDKEVKDTAQVLKDTEDHIEITADAVNRILDETNKQQRAVEHVLEQITNISDIISANSATAQESAAASEQLTAQSDILRTLIQTMRLR